MGTLTVDLNDDGQDVLVEVRPYELEEYSM
jgi:hypothetical protein